MSVITGIIMLASITTISIAEASAASGPRGRSTHSVGGARLPSSSV